MVVVVNVDGDGDGDGDGSFRIVAVHVAVAVAVNDHVNDQGTAIYREPIIISPGLACAPSPLYLVAMPTWLLVVFSVVAAFAAALFLLLRLTRGHHRSGIVTSRVGRTLRLFLSGVRMSTRWTVRAVRRFFTSKKKRAELDRRFHDETARAALETMGNMKGALMKLGQIVSFMDETLPPEYQEHLKALQCHAPPMPYDTVARVLEEELGHAPERLFAEIDRQPLASASIGQVHRATLWSGAEVAVKVQYPGVDRAIAADLDNVGMLMALIGAVTPTLDARPLAEEMRARLLDELDYELEAKNQAHFAALYAGHPSIVIPKVIADHSSRRVLTTEYVRGRRFYDFLEQADAAEKRAAVSALHTFVFDSIYVHHVFNGDPHPGNYLFPGGGKVAFLDFGCVKHFDSKFITDFQVLNRHYLLGERDAYFAKACSMGFIKPGHEHKVDRDWLVEWARWFYLPILEGQQPFRFTHDYCRQALGTLFGENMRRLNMPGEYLMLNRITFGLNSILAKLDACEDWRKRSLKYYFAPDEVERMLAA